MMLYNETYLTLLLQDVLGTNPLATTHEYCAPLTETFVIVGSVILRFYCIRGWLHAHMIS